MDRLAGGKFPSFINDIATCHSILSRKSQMDSKAFVEDKLLLLEMRWERFQ